jgi:hypothetical protein
VPVSRTQPIESIRKIGICGQAILMKLKPLRPSAGGKIAQDWSEGVLPVGQKVILMASVGGSKFELHAVLAALHRGSIAWPSQKISTNVAFLFTLYLCFLHPVATALISRILSWLTSHKLKVYTSKIIGCIPAEMAKASTPILEWAPGLSLE